PDSTTVPSEDIFAAVRSLGLADSLALDSLTTQSRGRRRTRNQADSAFADTILRAMRSNDTTAAAVRSLLRSREIQRQVADSGFNVFGLDMFDSQTSQFDPKMAVGADPNYRFGPGDRLTLVLVGDVERSQ